MLDIQLIIGNLLPKFINELNTKIQKQWFKNFISISRIIFKIDTKIHFNMNNVILGCPSD